MMIARIQTHRLGFCAAVLALAGSVSAAPPAAASQPASAPAPMDAYTREIAFAIPGSTPDAVSQAIVVVPRDYAAPAGDARRWPVVYLLHGYGVNHRRYHEQYAATGRSLTDLAQRYGVILVMPDGKCCSWYLNAAPEMPGAADWQWETVIMDHLLPAVDRQFRTWGDAGGRAITGISMGGHGALYLAARHPDRFAAASSMSGIMDLLDCGHPEDLALRLGPIETQRARWLEHSVLQQADRLAGTKLGLLLDCGWDDQFFWNHRQLHDKLMRLGVAHDYIERPGKHDWAYWYNALPYHLRFLADRLRPVGVR